MEFDDDRLDDRPAPPLLPLDDRLWRHPSEAAATMAWNHSTGAMNVGNVGPRLLTVACVVTSVAALIGLGTVLAVAPRPMPVIETRPAFTSAAANTAAIAGGIDMAAVAARVSPSVVGIETDGAGGGGRGSAVVYRADGILLTSHSVVTGAGSIQVVLHDGRRLAGRLVASDPETDIALVDVEGESLPAATLGSAAGLRVGEPAMTLAASAGTEGVASPVGTVSGVGRKVDNGDIALIDMVETDVPVPPGGFGGALVDRSGAVVGIAALNADTPAGLAGYATPIDVARMVADQMAANGAVTRVWLGVEGEDLSRARGRHLGLEGGAVVVRVNPGSPAATAGLLAGDVINSLDRRPITSMAALAAAVRLRRVGDIVMLSILRQGRPATVWATVAERAAVP